MGNVLNVLKSVKCVELLRVEDLLRYSNKTESINLRHYPYDHYHTNMEGEVTSQNLWLRYDRHFMDKT